MIIGDKYEDLSSSGDSSLLLRSCIADLTAYYDPAGMMQHQIFARNPDAYRPELLFSQLAIQRYPEDNPNLDKRGTGAELLLIDAIHAGLVVDGLAEFLGVKSKRARKIASLVDGYANRLADVTLGVARQVLVTSDKAKIDDDQLRLHIAVGQTIGANTQQGMVRKNKKAAYTHINGSMALFRMAWEKVQPQEPIETLYVSQLVLGDHDGPEDFIDPVSGHLASPKLFYSPRVVEEIALRLGYDVQTARGIGRTVLLMTRTRDAKGNKMEYVSNNRAKETYMARGLTYGLDTFDADWWIRTYARKNFAWFKPADQQQNKIDHRVTTAHVNRYNRSQTQAANSVVRGAELREVIQAMRSIRKLRQLTSYERTKHPIINHADVAERVNQAFYLQHAA